MRQNIIDSQRSRIINIDSQQLNLDTLNQYLKINSLNLSEIFKDVEPFVDLVVTSPPYWDMKDYGGVKDQTGYGQTYEDYLNDIETTFKGVYDICKDTSTLYLIIDTTKRNGKMIRLPDDIARRLENSGWIHQDTIIWDKGKTLPWSRKGQMRNVFEYILVFSKTSKFKYYIDRIKTVEELKEWWRDYPERYSPKGKVPDNIWEFYIPTQGSWGSKKDFGEEEFRHACPFPPEMVTRMIKLSTDENDVVFDPYSGTGVLLATAEQLNRRYLGADTNIEYKKVFENVTKNLVRDKMIEIRLYYRIQEKLQSIMEESIYKLRLLKYPNALLKKMRNLSKKDENYLANDFLFNFAIELPITKEEKVKSIIGKVKYILVWNNNETINKIQNQVNEIISKAPFTKYGLITDVEVITIEELINKKQLINECLYVYTKGNTKTVGVEFNTIEGLIDNLINNNEYKKMFDKDIPPLISNVRIVESDYDMLPAEEYVKRGYQEYIERYLYILDRQVQFTL